MITTAVQHASQMVEVEGAPLTAQANGDDFRVAFTASVSDSVARQMSQSIGEKASGDAAVSAGLSTVKARLAALSAKSASLSQGGFQSRPKLKDAGANEDATETASSSSVKDSSDLVSKNAATTGPSIDDPIAGDDLGLAVITRVANESPVETLDAGAENLPARVAVTGLAASTDVPKHEALTKSTDRIAVSARKDGVSTSHKEIFHAATAATVPDSAVAGDALVPVAVPVVALAQLPITNVLPGDGASIARQGTMPGVLTPVLQASDDAKSASVGVPSGSQDSLRADRFGSTGNFSLAATGLDEVASLQQGSLKSPAVTSGTARTGSPSGIASGAATAGKVAGSSSKIDQADIGRSITSTGLGESALALRSEATDAQSLSSAPEIQAKANTSSTRPQTLTAIQPAEVAQRRSNSSLQPQVAAQSSTSSVIGAAPEALARPGDSDGQKVQIAKSTDKELAGSETAPTLADSQIPQRLNAVRDVEPAIGVVPGAASKAVAAATKEEKSKRAEDGDEETATRSATAQTALGNIPEGVTNGSVAVTGGGARVVAVTDPATSAAQGATHNAASSGHAAGIETTSAAAVRAASSLNAGPVAESSSAAVQTSESHRTLLMTPTSLEVGVQSGTQGWLRIRAEVGDQGAVNASLAAGSSVGRDLLHSQMPALNAFLHGEQMAVTTTVVDRVGSLSGGQANAASGGLSGQPGSGNPNGALSQEGGAQGDGGQREMARHALNVNEIGASYNSRGSVTDGAELIAGGSQALGESGRWLNVRV